MSAPHRGELVELTVPPHSIEAEQSVLGGLLLDNSGFERIADIVAEADFYRDDHRRIYRHITRLIEANQPADVVTVDESIKASEDKDKTGGLAYLGALAQNTPSAHNIRRYGEIVHEYAQRRAVIALGAELQDRAIRGDLEELRAEATARLARACDGTATDGWPGALDLEALAEREPQPPRFIIRDWLPIGYATLLAGHGGIGKSAIALHLAVCIAAGLPFFGLEVARRCVLFLSCEDRQRVLHWRLARICSHLRVNLGNLRGCLDILDLVGTDAILWDRDPRTGYTITPAYGRLQERMRQFETEVLIVDGVADSFAGSENSRGEVKRFVNSLVALIPPDSGAVLLVGHVSKPGSTAGANGEGYSGSTSWHNSARARWYLYPETEQAEDGERRERTGDLILELQKSNLGRTDQSIRFAWDPDAHLFLARESFSIDRKVQDRDEQHGIRLAMKGCADAGIYVPAAMTGPRTAYLVLSQRPEFPNSLKGGGRQKTRRFWRQIEALRQMRHIAESSIERKHRKHTATLSLTSEGCAQCA